MTPVGPLNYLDIFYHLCKVEKFDNLIRPTMLTETLKLTYLATWTTAIAGNADNISFTPLVPYSFPLRSWNQQGTGCF